MHAKITAQDVHKILKDLGNADIAAHSQRFFKTGKGEYGEGDIFHGIRVPVIRKQVKKYQDVSFEEVLEVLKSPFHEERLFALLSLVEKFSKGSAWEKEDVYNAYLKHTKYINNWDLVDSSASYILGAYLSDKDKKPIYHLAISKDLWERRIAIMSTFYMIKKGDFLDAMEISKILINDREDLIHKAVGWMLREIGKRNMTVETTFLKPRYKRMPRIMLRYAIEKFPEKERKMHLNGLI